MIANNIANNSQTMAGYSAGSLNDPQSSATGIQTVSTGEVFRMGARQLTSMLGRLPNPAYYMTKLPGQILPAVLLLSRGVIAEGRTMPLTAAVQKTQGVLNGSIGVPDANGTSAADHGLQSDEAGSSKSKGRWATVPLPDSLDRPIRADELTVDKEFVRTGFGADYAVTQRQANKRYGSATSTFYQFSLPGLTSNELKQNPCTEKSDVTGNNQRESSIQHVKCSDADIAKASSKYDSELSNCFHMSWSSPVDDKGLLKSSGLYLGNCPAALSSKKISGAMDIRIPVHQAGPATIYQIHSIPDRLLYRDTVGVTGLLSRESSGATYNSLLADGMRFEPETPAPFSISIEAGEGAQQYLTIKGRSDYGRYTDGDCSVLFNATNPAIDQARCCHDQQQDTTYLHAQPINNFHSEWFSVRYEIKFSDYGRFSVKPGQVKVWVDDDMVVHAKLFIGGNDDFERGGGGYYATFGISDLRSEKPLVVKFRDVKFYPGILRNPPDSDIKPLTTVTGQCNASPRWLTTFCP